MAGWLAASQFKYAFLLSSYMYLAPGTEDSGKMYHMPEKLALHPDSIIILLYLTKFIISSIVSYVSSPRYDNTKKALFYGTDCVS